MKNISRREKISLDRHPIQKQNIYKEFIIPIHIPIVGWISVKFGV